MKIAVRSTITTDCDAINSWLEARNLQAILPEQLPSIGFIVTDVAAGFLYQTDSTVAYLETYVTNPAKKSTLRNLALDAITAKLLIKAAELGYTTVISTTKEPNIAKRAIKHNFVYKGNYALLVKET